MVLRITVFHVMELLPLKPNPAVTRERHLQGADGADAGTIGQPIGQRDIGLRKFERRY